MAAASSFYAAGDQLARNDAEADQATGTAGRETNQLPRTASPIALLGIIALLSIAGAAGLRATRP